MAAPLPFLRQIIDITNTGAMAVATTIGWHNNTGKDGNQQVVQTSDGDTLAETTDSWVVTADALDADDDNEVNGWAFQGFGGLAPSVLTLDDGHPVGFGNAGDEGLSAWFDLLIGAGETQSLMVFTVHEGPNAEGVAGTQSIYDPQTFAMLTSDLSPTRLAGVRNWNASAAVVPPPAGFGLLLAALGALGVTRRRRG